MRFALAASILAAAVPAFAHAAERATARATVAGKSVAIEYGRPELKGRDMLAQLQPGQAWRMGADAATSLTTEADLRFGPVLVAAGDYVLRATRGEGGQWTLNVHRRSAQGGGGDKLADVPLQASPLDASVEVFTIDLAAEGKRGTLSLKWGTTALGATFTGE